MWHVSYMVTEVIFNGMCSVFPRPATPPSNKKVWLLHSLIHRFKLPVHGEGEAEQAARISALPQDILRVQVESGQSPTSQEKDDHQQRQSTGDPALHGLYTSTELAWTDERWALTDRAAESDWLTACLTACRRVECCPLYLQLPLPHWPPLAHTHTPCYHTSSWKLRLPNFNCLVSKLLVGSRSSFFFNLTSSVMLEALSEHICSFWHCISITL